MKTRFSTLDIIAILPELRSKLCTGWRVNQVYDCDQKTFLFKLNKSIIQMKKDDDPLNIAEETANKMTFIIESGLRMHTTDYDWPKSHAPSHFATKLRKNIRNKRIEDIRQVGIDRLVDIQFGSKMTANHLMVELYDRGNLILTDHNYSIIAILRWRRAAERTPIADSDAVPEDSEDFKVGQKYPLSRCRRLEDLELPMEESKICELINNSSILLGHNQNYKKRNKAKQTDDGNQDINLKDLLNPYVVYGSSLLEDKILKYLSTGERQLKKCVVQIARDERGILDQEKVREYASLIRKALKEADAILDEVKERKSSPGYIVQKKQDSNLSKKSKSKNVNEPQEIKSLTTNIDFFPILTCAERKLQQEPNLSLVEFESFDKAVDTYYCSMESQKIDTRAFVAEKEVRKKLENLKLAQDKRLEDLARVQKEDEERARLIELNSDKVENALLVIRSMIANQISWSDIWSTIREAQSMKDPIASLITDVKFDRNEFTMKLCDPYELEDNCKEVQESNTKVSQGQNSKYKNVDIDISLSAYANARRFFVKRRTAVNKEKKTIEVSKKAFKNVERKTKEMIKEVVVHTNITKARKRYWFENFLWFISSDGYLVVAGRDSDQNELLFKRYMKSNDIFVHGDLHGASTVIIKNESSDPVPPKTLTEAGSMAVCYSSAWDSKIAATSWWVYPKQVSKRAEPGQYLGHGGFMIRGKKNYLPISNLVLGFGFLFRLGDESIERRKEARCARELTTKVKVQDATSIAKLTESEGETSEAESIEQMSDPSDSDERGPEASTENHAENHEVIENEETNSNHTVVRNDTEDVEEDDDDDDKAVEHKLCDSLTEFPEPDDVLLYAIPLCGPYSAMQSYKYKVKVVPGANKRGKAAKTCLGMFLHDKRSSQREKDLLRALKDQDYSRNIPNKVKISAPNMKSITKKKPKKSEVRLPIH